jgi:hypothetical protein
MTRPQGEPARDIGGGTQAGTSATSPDTPTVGPYVPPPAPHYDEATRTAEPHGAVLGFTVFAAVMLMISGILDFFAGLAAVIRGSFFVVLPHYVFEMSTTAWGWFHLILGAVVFVAGVALLADRFWARMVGVAFAAISAIVNFLYIPYQPVWSIVVIALDAAVIWALLTPRRTRL